MNSSLSSARQLPSFEQARARIVAAFPAPGRIVELPVQSSVGRVLAGPVRAAFAVPGSDVAEVDGIAIASRETMGASPEHPVVIECGVRIDTGRPLPPGADAVAPIEACSGGRLVLDESLATGDGVRTAGAELADGVLLLPGGHRVRPIDVGPLVAAGATRIPVRSVRVGVIPTGGELVPPGRTPGPGESVASNPIAIQALLGPQGVETVIHPIVPDDRTAVREAIDALFREVDLVIVCGGSGRGTRDVVFEVVRSLGEIVVDGVAARPGRAFLVVRAGPAPIVALPGRAQPASLLTELFVMPLCAAWGLPEVSPPRIRVRLGLDIESHPGYTETVPLSVARVGEKTVGLRQPRGRRRMRSQLRSNARLFIPDGVAGYATGEAVDAELLDDVGGPERTVLVVGDLEVTDFSGCGYRIAIVPCGMLQASALLSRSACHLAVVEDAREMSYPAWPVELADGRRVVVAAPPGLGDDPKVRAALAALGVTR